MKKRNYQRNLRKNFLCQKFQLIIDPTDQPGRNMPGQPLVSGLDTGQNQAFSSGSGFNIQPRAGTKTTPLMAIGLLF